MAHKIFTWHVISNSEGTVLGVFGEKILSKAQEEAASIERQTGMFVTLHTIVGPRPSVGQSISMKNTARREYK